MYIDATSEPRNFFMLDLKGSESVVCKIFLGRMESAVIVVRFDFRTVVAPDRFDILKKESEEILKTFQRKKLPNNLLYYKLNVTLELVLEGGLSLTV